jgi:hypothetical protein
LLGSIYTGIEDEGWRMEDEGIGATAKFVYPQMFPPLVGFVLYRENLDRKRL